MDLCHYSVVKLDPNDTQESSFDLSTSRQEEESIGKPQGYGRSLSISWLNKSRSQLLDAFAMSCSFGTISKSFACVEGAGENRHAPKSNKAVSGSRRGGTLQWPGHAASRYTLSTVLYSSVKWKIYEQKELRGNITCVWNTYPDHIKWSMHW